MSGWWFSSNNTEVKESKESKSSAKNLIQTLKEAAKEKTLEAENVRALTDEGRIRLCKNLFAEAEFLIEAKAIFDEYIKLNGATEPSLAKVSALFGYKTNQTFNSKASLAIGDVRFIRKELLPKFILTTLGKLKEIHDEIILNKTVGETSDLIAAILTYYRMPLEQKEFDSIKSQLESPLKYLEIFNVLGELPMATLSISAGR